MRENQLSRLYVEELLNTYEVGEVIAILLDEFPYLERFNRNHGMVGIEALMSDFNSYVKN